MKCSSCVLAFAALSYACQHEIHSLEAFFGLDERLGKRQEPVAFPPALDENESVLLGSIEATDIDGWSYYYTHEYHLAGTAEHVAQWTLDRWAENGFTSSLVEYETFLNYPVSKSLIMTYPNGSTYVPTLKEDVLPEDETTGYSNAVPTFHGYSFTGEAEGELVYVGRGQKVDFERLLELGVELEGKIALARYGGPFRGLKVKNSQEYGMVGTLIYTDIKDDGNVTTLNGLLAYPDGPARNPTAVQKGSVQFLSIYPGDPTTPGYPSKKDSPRTGTELVTPRIPSIPISWRDAQPLLEALSGSGPSGEEINRTNWIGAADVEYSSGPSPGVVVSMNNEMKENITTIWNVIGIINGTSPDEVVIVGNHRDAWMIGGAADPNSGSACLVEMAKAFGALVKTGWQPRRTIVLASWDAEEYGLLGSTEWVEEYLPWIRQTNVACINVDTAVSGSVPDISATPDFHAIGIEVMKKIVYPYHGLTNVTMYDVWSETNTAGVPGVLGSGSDYTAFLHGNGISSIDIGAGPGPEDPVYHYHSNYDTYHWMSTYADPGYKYHAAIASYVTLLTYHFANDEILPLEPAKYGAEMTKYLTALESTIEDAGEEAADLDLSELVSAIETFNASAAAFTEMAAGEDLDEDVITLINTKLRDYQRGFASNGGMPRRGFFQHVVFTPGLDTGYAPVTWPGVTEAIVAGNYTEAQSEVTRAAVAVTNAAGILMP